MLTQDELLRYYQRELTYLRQMGAAFARQYPKIANRLELGDDECADPHVERLLEGFAFLTARIQANLDNEFPEIPSALLGVLYPQFLDPLPSMTVARFDVDPAQGPLTTGFVLPRHTRLFAAAEDGLACRFRTAYPVTLWPLEITYAGFESTDQFDFLDAATDVATVLRLRLESRGGALGELALRRLRLHLNGDPTVVSALYELLFNQIARVAILPDRSPHPVFLPEDAIQPVGFDPEEGVLPYPDHAHPGYRLLQEYFTLPEKFLFADIDHLDRHGSQAAFDLLLMLKQMPGERLVVDRNTFCLGCTPIINLFPRTTEPIRLDERQTEYRLVADMRRERWTEIHSIATVSASSNPAEESEVFEPFYSFTHEAGRREHKTFWHARRVPTGRADLPGTEMRLSFLDLDLNPTLPPRRTVYAHTLCTNRRLADELPARTTLQAEGAGPIARVTCLGKPTPQLEPPLGGATVWRLVSQLSLNYLSLSEGRDSLRALREILRLANFAEHPSVDQQIAGLTALSARRVVRRLGPEAWRGFVRGTEVSLEFDEPAYVGSSPFLLAAVLNHFLALYVSVNSFTQLVLRSRQRPGIWKQWPPIAGRQIVL